MRTGGAVLWGTGQPLVQPMPLESDTVTCTYAVAACSVWQVREHSGGCGGLASLLLQLAAIAHQVRIAPGGKRHNQREHEVGVFQNIP